MALATHPLKGSCSTFPSVPSLWSRGSKLKPCVPAFGAVGRKDRIISLKCRSCTSVGSSLVLGPKSKSFKISAFKVSSQCDDSGGSFNSSKSLKNAGKVSYLQHKSEESSVESSEARNIVPAPHIKADEASNGSVAIQKLFKNWLMLLHTPSQSQAVEEVHEEPSFKESSEMPTTSEKQSGEMLKAVWCRFLGLDAAIKVPFLLFTPLYLAVNIVYGSKVSKELSPLWILGPLLLSLNIKIFGALCGLYAFAFKQTVKVVKNLPVYYSMVCDYVSSGKLKEASKTFIFQPLADIKNMNYNEVTRGKLKDLQGWLVERYLDFIELIWPWYCRTIRFLKRANFI